MDAWTDIGCNNSYLALTRHWIPDHEWNLYSAVLDVIPFSQRHTSENIACEVGFRLLDLKDSLLYCGTTDTAANFIRAMNLVLNNTWTSTINVDEMVGDG
jgi:hypothetical protein